MSDLKQGKLEVRTVKKGQQMIVRVPTKTGTREAEVRDHALSNELRRMPLAQRDGVEVEYELENNQPVRVRQKGQPWEPSQSISKQPDQSRQEQNQQRQGHSQGRQPMRRGQSQQRRQGQGQTQARQMAFHNPYNFVPALPRGTVKDGLGDAPPVGHHRYESKLWSGKITVRLTTESPLLIPDVARMTANGDDHKTYPVRLTTDGMPYIAPTSIKGMLRVALESVTNSRFGIFQAHTDRLAYRMEAGEGLGLVPARINGNQLDLLLGATSAIPDYDDMEGCWRVPGNLMYAAWLPRYHHQGGIHRSNAVKYEEDQTLPAHGNEVWAWVERVEHSSWDRRRARFLDRDFYYWRIRKIARSKAALGAATAKGSDPGKVDGRSYHRPLGEMKPIHGFVCITNQNINRKHDERVFFLEKGHALTPRLCLPLTTPLSEDPLARQWREMIDNYQAAHREQDVWGRRRDQRIVPPEEYIGREPGKTAWSGHIYEDGKPRRDNRQSQPDADKLADGTLCYARVVGDRSSYRVLALFPVMIARELYERNPAQLVSSSSLVPPQDRRQLSPAERVFGWVGQDGEGAYRGNLRIGSVRCVSWQGKDQGAKPIQEFSDQGVPLAILGQPKPQQARFYVAESDQGDPLGEVQDEEGRNRPREKRECYIEGQGLRGRKVYPHHLSPSDYWASPADPTMEVGTSERFKEYRRPQKNGIEQRDNQNRSILGWVKEKTAFTFDMHVTNLSDVELGALLWLLTLPDGHYHRLGGGKPLGFGSVRLTIDGLDLRDGESLAEWYRSLIGIASKGRHIMAVTDAHFGGQDGVVTAFQNAVGTAYGNNQPFDQVPFIRAFLRAAQGFADGLPIHYPRQSVSPDPEGENFKWFSANEKGPRISLGALFTPNPGLPRLEGGQH